MYDMKPLAPMEYRGEFNPIPTKRLGLEICELDAAASAARRQITILRGRTKLRTCIRVTCFTAISVAGEHGFAPGESRRPALGSVVTRLRPGAKDVPTYVSIENKYDWERAYSVDRSTSQSVSACNNPKEAVRTWDSNAI